MRFKLILFLSMIVAGYAFATDAQMLHRDKILKFTLSSKALNTLMLRVQTAKNIKTNINTSNLPAKKKLGMNGTPVLNQGQSFADAVFATTAAVDAALGRGDHVSQLCLLQLGNYMHEYGHAQTGLNTFELDRLLNFGFVSKEQQKTVGCGGLIAFPQTEEMPTSSISYNNYHAISEDLMNYGILWSPILDLYKAFNERIDTGSTLKEIKQTLNDGNRVTTTFIVIADSYVIGAEGTHYVKNDSWALSSLIERKLARRRSSMYIHSMVITGYDDNAVAIDENGFEHRGLLTLRGSWGSDVGDHGDFYMSYDYFQVLVLDAQQITLLQPDEDI